MILAIYGASGLGREHFVYSKKIERISGQKKYEDCIFVDDDESKKGTLLEGKRVLPFDDAIDEFGKENLEFILGIGEPEIKDIIFKKLKDNNCKITNLINPEALIPESTEIGEGIVVKLYNNFPPAGKVGNNVLIQSLVAIGHNVVLEDNVVLSSFAFVGGDTTIGRNTYVGPHSCIRNGLKIGENAVIGMGSVVTKDVPDNAVVYGNPAKVARINENKRVFSK